jgi:phosphoribosyl 1,2-cyclic phosphodiesterase
VKVTFCGTRGSTPAPGAAFVRYGGHTSCVAVSEADEPPRLLLDAGTGIRAVTDLLAGEPFRGTVLFGHLHWDHLQGLPFFAAAGQLGARVRLLLPVQDGDAESVLERAFSPPYFPVTPRELGAGWEFAFIDEGDRRIEGFEVRAREIPHKGGRAFGYRVSSGNRSFAYLSDHSPTTLGPGPDGLGARHEAALALARGADVLVHDAQQVAVEFPGVDYLGHSSVEYAVALAAEAGVATLVLFHHSPTRTDDDLDEVLAHTRRVAAAVSPALTVVAATDGMRLDIAGR